MQETTLSLGNQLKQEINGERNYVFLPVIARVDDFDNGIELGCGAYFGIC